MLTNCLKKLLIVALLAALLLVPSRSIYAQSVTPVPIGVFTERVISPDSRVEIPIEIKNVNGLYALDIAFEFDPKILQAVDADPATPGIQMALGNFLDPGMVLYNTVDNEKGKAHFVMTQVNPSEPKTGNGILLVIYFKAGKQGQSALTLTNAQLSTRDGVEIPTLITNSLVKIEANAPELVATSIPVQDAQLLTQIPPEQPTSTATLVPTPTPLVRTQESQTVNDSGIIPTQTVGQIPVTGFSIAAIWWFVLVLFILVLAAAGYLFLPKKNKGQDRNKQ
jgi:hypothetical protein